MKIKRFTNDGRQKFVLLYEQIKVSVIKRNQLKKVLRKT